MCPLSVPHTRMLPACSVISYHELTFTEAGYFVRIPCLLGVSVFPQMILHVLMPGVPGTLCSIAKFSVYILKWGFTEYNKKCKPQA